MGARGAARAHPEPQAREGRHEPRILSIADQERILARIRIENVWIHMNRDTPEALELASERGLNVRTGTCAVMYVRPGLSCYSVHKWIHRALGKY